MTEMITNKLRLFEGTVGMARRGSCLKYECQCSVLTAVPSKLEDNPRNEPGDPQGLFS